jgi:hypothetical protein
MNLILYSFTASNPYRCRVCNATLLNVAQRCSTLLNVAQRCSTLLNVALRCDALSTVEESTVEANLLK